MHQTFTSLDEPSSPMLQKYLLWYGQESRPIADFDILSFPEIAAWISIAEYYFNQDDQYDFDRTATIYAGSEIVRVLGSDETGKTAAQTGQESRDRWAPFYWQAVKKRRAIFAETFAHGIGKDFIRYEVGAFPFHNDKGLISHIVLAISVL